MQITLYFSEEDEYLVRLIDEKARRERRSRSSVVISILEEHLVREKRLGEILVLLGDVHPEAVEKALEAQAKEKKGKRIGEILVEQGSVSPEAVERALLIQERARARSNAPVPTAAGRLPWTIWGSNSKT